MAYGPVIEHVCCPPVWQLYSGDMLLSAVLSLMLQYKTDWIMQQQLLCVYERHSNCFVLLMFGCNHCYILFTV